MKRFIFLALLALSILCAPRAFADVLGDSHAFSISSQYDARGRTTIQSSLIYISNKAYFYIENDYWASLNSSVQQQMKDAITTLAREFDTRIYPAETNFFGSEPNPGIDNDPRLTIMLAPLVDYAGGYYDTTNQQPKSIAPTSNEREIIYLNSSLILDGQKSRAFLAHEFQHLITYNQKEILHHLDDDVWINEMRSEYAVELMGYNSPFYGSNLERRLRSFTDSPNDSLTEWKNLQPDYGIAVAFGEYLVDRWSPQIFADSARNGSTSIASINESLAKNGFKETFTDVFVDWMIASYLNDPSLGLKYSYSRESLRNLHVIPNRFINNLSDDLIYAVTTDIKDWEGRWYDITNFAEGNNKILKINFNSASLTSFIVPYVVFYTDGTKKIETFVPTQSNSALYFPDIGSRVARVLVMPLKKDRLAGFVGNEPAVRLTLTIERIARAEAQVVSTPVATPTPSTTPLSNQSVVVPMLSPTPQPSVSVKPSDFGFKEGDFIRAKGDIDVYIINNFGYKRRILNPAICRLYGHLGKNGCFSVVKEVTPQIRDAFQTSWFYTNGETHDGIVYFLKQTGSYSGVLNKIATTISNFINAQRDSHSIFSINSREENLYKK